MSALLTADETALIGSPGPFTWRGTVFAVSVAEDFLFRDKTHYHIPVRPSDSPVDKYAYLGMAVEAGNFLPEHQSCGQHLTYAAGAPRAADNGKVVLFVRCSSAELLSVRRVLRGDGFAASFGYSLAAADINGDGFTDLFVGAPFYHQESIGVGGAVYAYKNGPDGLVADEGRIRLVGQVAEGRFGLSLANAGDLDNDGFDDVIIGAPYDGRGKVFIYLGGEEFWPASGKAPDQIIAAEQVRGSFPSTTFGFSLVGGVDLDANNHSDIMVGAFDSSVAVVLRTRPVIDIVTWFGEHPDKIDPEVTGCAGDPLADEVCFTVESCFMLKNFPSNIERTDIQYSLSAEVFSGGRKVSRVRLGSGHRSTKIVAVYRNRLTGCFLETAYLRKEATDLTTPIVFQLSLRLIQDSPIGSDAQSVAVANINHFPMLHHPRATRQLVLPFQMSCGDDDRCVSKLSVQLKLSDMDEELRRLEIKDKHEVVVTALVQNEGESAYAAILELALDSSFSYVGRSDNVDGVSCEFDSDAGKLRCRLGNPYDGGRADELRFRVLPRMEAAQVRGEAAFNATVTTSSENAVDISAFGLQVEVVKRSEVSLHSSVQPSEMWFGGIVRGESAMKKLSDVGSKVTHTFHVNNDGPWHVGQFEVLVDWPYQLAIPGRQVGKWLLYLVGEVEISPPGAATCFINPRLVNQLGLQRRGRRQKRSNDDAVVVLNCEDERAECVVLSCRVFGLRAGESVVLRLRSRVWNSTLVEEFGGERRPVRLDVSSRLLLHPDSRRFQDQEDDVTVASLLALPSPGDGGTSIPLWVVALAGTVGVLLVVLIVAILYKLGFFKRHRHYNDLTISAKVTGAASAKGDEYIS